MTSLNEDGWATLRSDCSPSIQETGHAVLWISALGHGRSTSGGSSEYVSAMDHSAEESEELVGHAL